MSEVLNMLLLLATLLQFVRGTHIEFYEKTNFTDFLFETSSITKCTNIVDSKNFGGVRGSIKTDTCLVVYLGEDCTYIGMRIPPGGMDLDEASWNTGNTSAFEIGIRIIDESYKIQHYKGVVSYETCAESQQGGSLEVDIYSRIGKSLTYRNVCSCTNTKLPDFLHVVGLTTRGSPLMIYMNENCTGKASIIPMVPEYVYGPPRFTVHPVFKSFGPYEHSMSFNRHCASDGRLDATVFNFEFANSSYEDEAIVVENVDVAAQTIFRNNGTAKLTQKYSFSKKVREVTEVEIASSLKAMHNVNVSESAGISFEIFKIPSFLKKLLSSPKLEASLKAAYNYQHLSGSSYNTKTTVETEREFTVSMEIEVGPCTEYSVHSFVKMVTNRTIDYKVYTKISGWLDRDKMTISQIRKFMDKRLEYVKDFDENTVIVVAKGAMTAEYGIGTTWNGNGREIPDCGKQPVGSHETPEGTSQSDAVTSVLLVSIGVVPVILFYVWRFVRQRRQN